METVRAFSPYALQNATLSETTMLPRPLRLRARKDFQAVYRQGRSWANRDVVLYLRKRNGDDAPNPPHPRIGFVISKKVGKAVVRNRLRRRLREAVRLQINRLKQEPYDLVFIARSSLLKKPWSDVLTSVNAVLQQAGVLDEAEGECSSEGARQGS